MLDIISAALDALCGDFLYDRYGEIPAGKLVYYAVCVFNDIAGRPVCCGKNPDIVLGSIKVPGVMRAVYIDPSY